MSYIAYPLNLRFIPDEHVHTGFILKQMAERGNKLKISGDVKACIGDTWDEALNALQVHVLESLPHLPDNWAPWSHWKLQYDVQEIKDGKVWSGGGTYSETGRLA